MVMQKEKSMPYKSEAQRKFFHTDTARKSGITPKMVSEYDKASVGKSLPKKVGTHSRPEVTNSAREAIERAIGKCMD